jgi:DNA repair photolyase
LKGVLRIFNSDPMILGRLVEALNFFSFPHHVEVASARSTRLVRVVRLTGGLSTHVRFFLTVDPAITRKRTFEGQAVKNSPPRRIVSVTNLGLEMPMFDITTGTGDFIAHGVISHNCFARPTHDYLGLGIGEDFERKLVVKVNAVEKVKAELRSPKWEGDLVAMGTNTDPYQRAEGKYHLTRGIVEALGAARNPFSILTKGTLILRDVDVLAKAAERTDVRCAFSIGTLDETVWRATEPGTPHPRRRVEAVRRLNEAGIPTGVLVAPILPGLSDRPEQLEEVTEACIDAGATSITPIALHLRPGVKEHFLGFLDGYDPALAARLRARYGTRSYLPTKDQDAITAPVRAVLRRRR